MLKKGARGGKHKRSVAHSHSPEPLFVYKTPVTASIFNKDSACGVMLRGTAIAHPGRPIRRRSAGLRAVSPGRFRTCV